MSDDLRMHSGIATQSKEFVIGTIGHYQWVQIAGAVKHPDEGRIVDIKSDSNHDLIDCLVALINSESGDELITGKASVKILKGNASNG